MTADPITLDAAPEGRYRVEREIGEDLRGRSCVWLRI